MARRPTAGVLCWILAILLHGDVLVILMLALGGDEEIDDPAPESTTFHCALVQPRPVVQVELRRDSQLGRWPLKCDHGLRTVEIADDRLRDGLRCDKCGWLWWVIRAASSD